MKTEKIFREHGAKAGITRTGVVVCIALFFFMGYLGHLKIRMNLRESSHHRYASYARGIYTQIYAASSENIGGRTNYWAASSPNTTHADYQPTSTDYFRWLMTPYDIKNPAAGAEVVQQDFIAFALPGMGSVSSLDEFSAETNPWMVVADLDERSPSGIPFMITRNLNETALQGVKSGSPEKLENLGVGTYDTPFGRERLIVIRIGGEVEILKNKLYFFDAPPSWRELNPTSATNLILQP